MKSKLHKGARELLTRIANAPLAFTTERINTAADRRALGALVLEGLVELGDPQRYEHHVFGPNGQGWTGKVVQCTKRTIRLTDAGTARATEAPVVPLPDPGKTHCEFRPLSPSADLDALRAKNPELVAQMEAIEAKFRWRR